MGSDDSDRVNHKAPKGKFRVVVFDSFDHGEAIAGDFPTLEAAQARARDIGRQQMTIAYIHNDKGVIVGKYGSY